MSILTQFVHFL